MEKTFKQILAGFLIGLAVIVPGISGATIAIMFKIYNNILDAIASINKNFKKSMIYLLPIGVGGILGILMGFIFIKELLKVIPFAITTLFGGLILGSIFSLIPENKKAGKIFLVVGIICPIILCLISFFHNEMSLKLNYYLIFYYVIVGSIVASTQYIPGCSASVFLMSIGLFTPLITNFNLNIIINNKAYLLIYCLLFLGFVIGALFYAKLINKFINILGAKANYLFLGLSIGSFVSIFINYDMVLIYKDWYYNSIKIFDLLLGISLFIVGVMASYRLYLRGKNR